MGTFEISATSSILKEGKSQALFPRILAEVDTGMCLDLSVTLPPRAVHFCLLAVSLMNSVRKQSVGGVGRIFFPLQTRDCMFLYQEGDLGRSYIPAINSMQAIVHSLNDDCCLH